MPHFSSGDRAEICDGLAREVAPSQPNEPFTAYRLTVKQVTTARYLSVVTRRIQAFGVWGAKAQRSTLL
jgi:hypothetical protein